MATKKENQKPFTKKAIQEGYTLSNAMKEAREKAGYTQQQLADLMDVSLSCIQKTEQNDNKITAYVVFQYCRLLNVPPEYFLFSAEPEERKTLMGEINTYLTVLPDEMLEAILSIIKQYAEKK